MPNELETLRELVKVLEDALREIAEPIPCGCMPCMGACRCKESLEIELEGRREAARAALTPPQAKPAREVKVWKDVAYPGVVFGFDGLQMWRLAESFEKKKLVRRWVKSSYTPSEIETKGVLLSPAETAELLNRVPWVEVGNG